MDEQKYRYHQEKFWNCSDDGISRCYKVEVNGNKNKYCGERLLFIPPEKYVSNCNMQQQTDFKQYFK